MAYNRKPLEIIPYSFIDEKEKDMVIESTTEGPQEGDESSSLMQAVLGQQQTLVMRDYTPSHSPIGS